MGYDKNELLEKETRYLPSPMAAVRLDGDDGETQTIVGHASVYYDGTTETEYELWDGARERIMPGAFQSDLNGEGDVRALVNHDPNYLLGRQSSGTLSLSDSPKGLQYAIRPGRTTVASDTIEHLRRGDLNGSSFSFKVIDERWKTEDSVEVREITAVRLFDVGPVTFPTYENTTASVRAQIERMRAERHKGNIDWISVARARLDLEEVQD